MLIPLFVHPWCSEFQMSPAGVSSGRPDPSATRLSAAAPPVRPDLTTARPAVKSCIEGVWATLSGRPAPRASSWQVVVTSGVGEEGGGSGG